MDPTSSSGLPSSSIRYRDQHISLDGTERNFHEAVRKIKPTAAIQDSEPYDSDEDFSEYQEREGGYDPYIWRDGDPVPPARHTTVTCMDGNVKGNVFLTKCRNFIRDFLNAAEYVPGMEYDSPGSYLATCAGKFAKIKTSLDCSRRFSPGEYTFGRSGVEVMLTKNERLFITDQELRDWITNYLELEVKRWDLPYKGYDDVIGIKEIIAAIKSKIFSHAAPKPRLVPDNQLGTIQLYCAFPKSYPLGDGPYAEILGQGALHKFLDFFNALIFGVEGSRNNLVFLTGLLVLIDMRYGSYPGRSGKQEGKLFYDDLLDLFPMSVTGTGAGNFVAEKAMYIATRQLEKNSESLEGERALGFSTVRKNPAWLKVTLKSAILVYNWLENIGITEYASQKPIRRVEDLVPVAEKDDLETAYEKSEKNLRARDNFFENLDEQLYEVISHHYLR